MIKTDHVRAQAAVQAFDFTEKLAEYGFSTGTRADIDDARRLITEMVQNADADMERVIRACDDLGQNPYKRSVTVNGREFKVAMEIPLFGADELTSRIERVFAPTTERPRPPQPDPKVISARITEALSAMLKDAGYEVCGIEHTDDGSPMRVVLRDPVYAAQANERDGGEPVVASITAMGSTLRELGSAARGDLSAEALGLYPQITAEQVLTVRGVVKQVIDNAEHDLMRHIQALKASGVSPYSADKLALGGDYTVVEYVDKALAPWRFGRSVDKPAVITSIDNYAITRVLDEHLPHAANCLNRDTFCSYVRQALVERLRSVPDLPLAAVTRDHSSPCKMTIVLVSPDAYARSRQGFVARLFTRQSPSQLALPAPAQTSDREVAGVARTPAALPSTNGGFAVPQ